MEGENAIKFYKLLEMSLKLSLECVIDGAQQSIWVTKAHEFCEPLSWSTAKSLADFAPSISSLVLGGRGSGPEPTGGD